MKKFICTLLVLVSFATIAHAIETIGGVQEIQGKISVYREGLEHLVTTGMLIQEKDIIITHAGSKVTLIFRDGSLIRIFPNTKLVAQKARDKKLEKRIIAYNLELAYGTVFGKFLLGGQRTQIFTPVGVVQIKEAEAMIIQKNEGLSVSLSSGSLFILNDDEVLQLKAGNLVQGVKKTGAFTQKVQTIPYRLSVEASEKNLTFEDLRNKTNLFFTFQLEDVKTMANLYRMGKVYISSNTSKILFPEVRLNKRGYARVIARVLPHGPDELEFGQIKITAVLEQENAIDTGVGKAVVNIGQETKNDQRGRITPSR